MQTLAAAAVEYAQSGFAVLPLWSSLSGSCACPRGPRCDSPGKHPDGRLVAHGLSDASVDVETVRSWWERHPTANIGIATGGGVVVVDIDGDRLPLLLAEFGAWPDTCVARTGRGEHWYFGADADIRISNRQAFRPGVDIRGDGGYVVAPPSQHASGNTYTWIRDLGHIAPAPPELLHALVVTSADRTETDSRPSIEEPVSERHVPATEVALIEQALEVIPANQSREHWIELVTMPLHDFFGGSETGFAIWHRWCARGRGQTTPNGNPAYTGERDCRRQWRSLRTQVRNPRGIGTFWRHAMHHGWRPPAETSVNGRIDSSGIEPSPDWSDPEPVFRPTTAPTLDRDRAYPSSLNWLRRFTDQIADLQQVDPAFPAILSLGMLAGAAGREFTLKLDGTGWEEPLALWIICALESGAGKSPVFRPLVRPFEEFEIEVDAEQRQQFADWQSEVDAAHAIVTTAQSTLKRLASKDDAPPIHLLRDELIVARRALAAAEANQPQSRKILASNLTTPALVEFFQRHHERCLIVDPEGQVFQHALAGRTDSERDLDPWLKSFSCEPIKQNRVGDRRGPIERHVHSPTLSMALCTQTGALDLFRDRYAESRGFLARFIAATFDHALPSVAIVRGEIPIDLSGRWRDLVLSLLRRPVPDRPETVLLAGDSAEMFASWMQNWLDEARLDQTADLLNPIGYATPSGAKLRSIVLRTILLFHVVSDPETASERHVDEDIVDAVLTGWSPFFRDALARTLLVIRDDPARRVADRILTFIDRQQRTTFTRSEAIWSLSDSKIQRVDDLNPSLSILVDAGWIRPLDKPRFRGAGTVPAATRYCAHPEFQKHYARAHT